MPPPHSNSNCSSNRPRVAVLGATLGTGNLGVDALGMAMVQGLREALPKVELLYQSWEPRPVSVPLGDSVVQCEPLVIRRKDSLRHRNGVVQLQKAARIRTWLSARSMSGLPTFSHTLKQLLSCDAVLDVSAGDSFADIYGKKVFWYQSRIKLLCLELGIPLVLMPQTYGPFADEACARTAADILSRAALVCSREAEGSAEIEQLCGDRPPRRLVRVPDMAFLLEPRETPLPANLRRARSAGATCIALNVSGLLYFSHHTFGLQVDYQQLCQRLLRWALTQPKSHVLLVPHVVASSATPRPKISQVASVDTNDITACKRLAASVSGHEAKRVEVLRNADDPAKAKYAMSHCDFLIGARMHAFIGAISQLVPGTLLAYSKKANGLASLLGIGNAIVDPRQTSMDDCLAQIDAQFQARQELRQQLKHRIPLAQEELHRFFREEIAPLVQGQNQPAAPPQSQNGANFSQPYKRKVAT